MAKRPNWTARTYEMVAETLRLASEVEDVRRSAQIFCAQFQADNPRFDADRFLDACGIPKA